MDNKRYYKPYYNSDKYIINYLKDYRYWKGRFFPKYELYASNDEIMSLTNARNL